MIIFIFYFYPHYPAFLLFRLPLAYYSGRRFVNTEAMRPLIPMTSKNPHSLENFVERHRADFDVHEPRPDLWAALEQQLDTHSPAAPASTPMMMVAADETPQETKVLPLKAEQPVRATARPWLQRYGIAAALAALVMAAGASEIWKTRQPATEVAANVAAPSGPLSADDAALYLGDGPQTMLSSAQGDSNSIRLASAVRGMEAYYSSQLSSRQAELSQLSGPGAAGMTADWQRELAALDSSYRQLKTQLPSHPQPEAVLTAMNRNLQIRLDILDQQLHLGNARPAAEDERGSYVLADSRSQPE